MKIQPVSRVISSFTQSHAKWQLICEMSIRTFYPLDYPILTKDNKEWWLFKYTQPTSVQIQLQGEPVKLFYGSAYSLGIDNKPFGLLLAMPKINHKVYEDCFISAPKSVKDIDALRDKAEVTLLNNEYTVMVLDKKVQYLCAKNNYIQSILK